MIGRRAAILSPALWIVFLGAGGRSANEPPPDAAEAPARELSPDAAEAPARELSPDAAEAPARELSPDAAEAPARELNPDAAGPPARELSPDAAEAPAGKPSPVAKGVAGKGVAGEGAASLQALPSLHSPIRFFSAAPGAEIGLLRVNEAFTGQPMSLRLSLHGSFSASDTFLNYNSVAGYSQSSIIGRLGIGFSPFENVELFLSLRSSSNKNSTSQPNLLQTQGDIEFGGKGVYPILPWLWIGLDLAVALSNGIGEFTPSLEGTNLRTALLLSFDARPLIPQVPLRAHLNAGFVLENTGSLAVNRELSWVEQYALNVNQFHRARFGFGIDLPLAYLAPVGLSPFLEFSLELPVNVTDADLRAASLGSATTLWNIMPMRLTPGIRITYKASITLDLAVDIGVGSERAYIDGVPSVEPWRFWLGITYSFDPRQGVTHAPAVLTGHVTNQEDGRALDGATIELRGASAFPVATQAEGMYRASFEDQGSYQATCSRPGFLSETREVALATGGTSTLDFSLKPTEPSRRSEPAKPSTGRIVGRVVGAADQMPIPLAIVTLEETGLTPVASDEFEGKYTGYDLPPGTYTLNAKKAGFRPLAQTVEVKAGETSLLDFALEADFRPGTLSGTVLSEKGKPLHAKISIQGPKAQELATDAKGTFATELPPGGYVLSVSADGHMAKSRQIAVREGERSTVEFRLSPRPAEAQVIFRPEKKKIELNKKVHFRTGSAELLVDSHQLLDGVVEVLVDHSEIRHLRIEGHTDSQGPDAYNLRLSQARADAVMKYLSQQGIEPTRLAATGYGESHPIAPNTSNRGREQNRRVEFVILE